MKHSSLILLLCIVLLNTGCEKEELKARPIPVQSISFIDAPAAAGIGQPVKLSIKTFPENADVPYTLEWEVDKTLADFDETTQTLTRKAKGNVTVTVKVKDHPEVKASVTINPIAVQSITFKTKCIEAEIGKSVKVEIVTTPEGADVPELNWTLSKNIATFDNASKMLTLNQAGLAELTASLNGYPTIKDVCTVKDPNTAYIPDPLLKQKLLKYDTNNNGEIERSEAEAVTELTLGDMRIKSLEGIEYFTNIQSLYCYSNYINNIDVSKNTKLKLLYCDNTPITTLDLSKNIDLESIYLSLSKIETLDLSKNTKLKFLDLQWNTNLSSIDLSQNIDIEAVRLMHMDNLSSVNTSKNINIKTINYTYNCKLSSIDISQNLFLNKLYCSNNNLSTLDISKNVKLTTADFTINPKLSQIVVWKGFTTSGRTFEKDATTTYVEIP